VDGEALPEGGDLLGEAVAGLLAEPGRPGFEHVDGRLEEAFGLLGIEIPGPLERREPGGVEDLVRVGVADAGEDARIGEGALERPVLGGDRPAEAVEIGPQNLQPAGIVLRQGLLAPDHVERRPFLGAHLGQQKRAVGEVERCEAVFARDLDQLAPLRHPPPEAPGDHEVEDEEEWRLLRLVL